MNTVDVNQAVEILKQHNAWRRDDSGVLKMQNPKELGMAIERVLMCVNSLQDYEKITYHLVDDVGANTISLPVLIPEGVTFKHEYGHYIVEEILRDGGEIIVICERLSRKGI